MPTKRPTGRPAHETAQSGLALCGLGVGRRDRRVASTDAEGSQSHDSGGLRPSGHHAGGRLSAVPSGRRRKAGAGTASQTAGLLPLPCAAVMRWLRSLFGLFVLRIWFAELNETNQIDQTN